MTNTQAPHWLYMRIMNNKDCDADLFIINIDPAFIEKLTNVIQDFTELRDKHNFGTWLEHVLNEDGHEDGWTSPERIWTVETALRKTSMRDELSERAINFPEDVHTIALGTTPPEDLIHHDYQQADEPCRIRSVTSIAVDATFERINIEITNSGQTSIWFQCDWPYGYDMETMPINDIMFKKIRKIVGKP